MCAPKPCNWNACAHRMTLILDHNTGPEPCLNSHASSVTQLHKSGSIIEGLGP